jgi:hypothetical protein
MEKPQKAWQLERGEDQGREAARFGT